MEKEAIVIDTNIFVDHLRNFAPAVKFFESIIEREDIYFSAITEAELIAGKANNDNDSREKLLHFLHRWNKLPVDNPLVMIAGDLSRKYGMSIPDAIIASTALSNGAELITKNTKDFNKIPGLKIKSPY